MADATAFTELWMDSKALPVSSLAIEGERVLGVTKRAVRRRAAQLTLIEVAEGCGHCNPVTGLYVFLHDC